MRRNVTIIALAALLLLTSVGPVLAAELPGVQCFTLVGIVESASLTADGGTITVQVYHGNRFIQRNDWIGKQLTVNADADAEYRQYTPAGCIPATYEIVQPGKTVSIHGMVSNGTFTGDRITIGVPLTCCTP